MTSLESIEEVREMSNVAIACNIMKKDPELKNFATDCFMEDAADGEAL